MPTQQPSSSIGQLIEYLDGKRKDDVDFRNKQLELETRKFEAGQEERKGMVTLMGRMMDRLDRMEK